MVKNILLTLMLPVLSLTALYAQVGKDSIVCYKQSELVKIANMMNHAHECDSLYGIVSKQLQLKTEQGYAYREALSAKDKELNSVINIAILKDKIILGKDIEIGGLRDVLKKGNRQLKWTRIGWLSTSALLTYIILRK